MAEAVPVAAVTQLLALDWTQISVIIGALVTAVGLLAWVVITGAKKREADCSARVAELQTQIVEVLQQEVQRGQVALDKSAAAIQQNSSCMDESRKDSAEMRRLIEVMCAKMEHG
jgi:hypothetical protein